MGRVSPTASPPRELTLRRCARPCGYDSSAIALVAPLGKKGLLKLLDRGPLPVTFGSPHPFVAVVAQDGVFRLRELVVDSAESAAVSKAALAAGASFMPEHHYALGKPTGRVHLEAKTLAALRALIEAFPWPEGW